MRILVLGAAAGGGFPQWNCNCRNCWRVRAGDPTARPQTQASLAVSLDGRLWFLLNASPDLRQQIGNNAQLHPRSGRRNSPIAGVVLTSGGVDHVAGLLSLRESQPLAIYATSRALRVLDQNAIFGVLSPRFVRRRPVMLGWPFELATTDDEPSGLTVEAFPVPGKLAHDPEDAEQGPDVATQEEETVGLRISGPGGAPVFYYVPGCGGMTPELAARLRGAPLVLFDGTLWTDDEMLRAGLGTRTGRRMGHMSISGPDGSLAAFTGLDVERRLYIHLNNTNPVLLRDSPERRAVQQAGWEVAEDGMEIRL